MDRLEIIDLHKMYEGAPLLDGVSFYVVAGETLCLLGSSGSGKSTILRIIAGIETQDAGSILWRGKDVSAVPAHRRGFGLMFQDYALFPHLNVSENIAFGLRMQRVAKDQLDARVFEALERVNMTAFASRRVTDLSGGEQQRVALARALAPRPQLLMLDEPLAALDRSLRVELQEDLRELLHQTGIPAIYVTHDQEEAILLGDRLALLHNGRIVQSGLTEEVYRQPANTWVARFLGMTNLLEGRVVSVNPLMVQTACGTLGPFVPGYPSLLSPGQVVHLLVRLDGLFSGEHQPSAGSINGEVTECRFMGDHYRVRMKVGECASLECFTASPLVLGKALELRLNAEDVVVLPE